MSNKDNHPLVSVIIPVFNAERYISEAIKSVLKQTYTNWELLVIDDGSTDHTKNVIKEYLKSSSIKYYYKENGGQGSARNLGVKKSNGGYLAFLDADDVWDSEKLELQVKCLQEKSVSLVFSKLKRIDAYGRNLNKDLGGGKGILSGFRTVFLLAAGNLTIPNSSVLILKECFNELGYYKESRFIQDFEDYDMWFRVLLSGYEIYGMGKVLGSYRIHKAQKTYSDPGSCIRMIKYFEKMIDRYPMYKKYFEFIALLKLTHYYQIRGKATSAKQVCLRIFFSSKAIRSYTIEKSFINVIGIEKYFRIRRIFIREFKTFKNFVASIE